MFEKLAKKEGISLSRLQNGLKSGSIVAVKNAKRDVEPIAIGTGTRVKINANIGTSPDVSDIRQEIEKAHIAVEAGADTLMDLSIGGDIDSVRRKILKETCVPLGTVPIYQAFLEKRLDMDSESILKVIERHCKDGVDFLTIHSGITKDIVEGLKSRLIPVTSRGGSFLAAWMIKNQKENPLYSEFDDILEIAKEYEVTLSLGDALRPACIHDASDNAQIQELLNLGRLTKKAREAGVQIIIEGPGHMPLDQIEMNVKLEKKICDNAPFYVLGPLVTDIGMGRDHITGAIGGAVAAMHGADFLCYVTPSEHLGLPTKEDVREGVIASKIAAHAADIVRLRDTSRDDELSKARKDLDWNKMFELCLDNKLCDKYNHLKNKKECTMCGQYCALKILKEWVEK
jgi:phosphomethylpyrimidine synthase